MGCQRGTKRGNVVLNLVPPRGTRGVPKRYHMDTKFGTPLVPPRGTKWGTKFGTMWYSSGTHIPLWYPSGVPKGVPEGTTGQDHKNETLLTTKIRFRPLLLFRFFAKPPPYVDKKKVEKKRRTLNKKKTEKKRKNSIFYVFFAYFSKSPWYIWGQNLIPYQIPFSLSTLDFSSSISRRNRKFVLVVDFEIKFENFGVGRNFCHLRASERFIFFFFFQKFVKNVSFFRNSVVIELIWGSPWRKLYVSNIWVICC